MVDRVSSTKRTRHGFALICASGLFLFLLSIALSACGITLLNSNCSGVQVSCDSTGSTLLSPDLTVQAHAVATAHAIKKSNALVRDPLSRQDSNSWSVDDHCSFHDGAYFIELNGLTGTYGCDSGKLHYGDVAIQMDVTLISGQTVGIIFRADATFSEYYDFQVGQGKFMLDYYAKSTFNQLITPTDSSAVRGTGEKNTLLVITRGNDLRFFINGTFVAEAHDSSLTNGYVGMILAGYANGRASFSNLVIYRA